ncbi:MAG: transposase, partial [Treponema sp.]|nr:transposase [Treponema sp.]
GKDNLNTHTPASLYETFEPEEAKRIRDRLEIHHTPKQGSWLNMAEIELSVLNNHGLSDRIPTIEQMRQEVRAWNQIRNEKACTIDWRFTTADARIKLKRLYPRFSS